MSPSRPTNQNGTCFVYLTPTPSAVPFEGPIPDPWPDLCDKLSKAIESGTLNELKLTEEEQTLLANNSANIPTKCRDAIINLWNNKSYIGDATQFMVACMLWINECKGGGLFNAPPGEDGTPILNIGQLSQNFVNTVLPPNQQKKDLCTDLFNEAIKQQNEFIERQKNNKQKYINSENERVSYPDPTVFVNIVKGLASGLRNTNPSLNSQKVNNSGWKTGLTFENRGMKFYKDEYPSFKLPMTFEEFGLFVASTKDIPYLLGQGAGYIPGGLLAQWGASPNVDTPEYGKTDPVSIEVEQLETVASLAGIIAEQINAFINNLKVIPNNAPIIEGNNI